MEITEEIAHIQGMPKKLVVFLHGYIDCAQGIEKTISDYIPRLHDCALHIPQAPIICEIHEKRRQWYSMHRFDPDDARKYVPTMRECASIYNKMTLGFEESFEYLNPYLDNLLQEYQLEDKDLYLCGFSQGAMLAIYTALMREKEIAGCVSFSGIMAPYKYMEQHAKSTPPFLLIHGDADNLVRFAALKFTKQKLEKLGAEVSTVAIKDGLHQITSEGLEKATYFITTGKLPADED